MTRSKTAKAEPGFQRNRAQPGRKTAPPRAADPRTGVTAHPPTAGSARSGPGAMPQTAAGAERPPETERAAHRDSAAKDDRQAQPVRDRAQTASTAQGRPVAALRARGDSRPAPQDDREGRPFEGRNGHGANGRSRNGDAAAAGRLALSGNGTGQEKPSGGPRHAETPDADGAPASEDPLHATKGDALRGELVEDPDRSSRQPLRYGLIVMLVALLLALLFWLL